MATDIERAIAIGEIAWAVRLATSESRKAKGKAKLAALRLIAELELGYADDTDLPWLMRAAKAWSAVTKATGATARDREMLAWSELLANRPRKAKQAMGGEIAVLSATIAWAMQRDDEKRRDAVVQSALAATEERRALAARALAQAERCPNALRKFLPKAEKMPTTIEAMQARVARVTKAFGATSAALELPLLALAANARDAQRSAIEIEARRRLDPILAAKGSGAENLLDRHVNLGDLRRALTKAKRFDEAFLALEQEEKVKAKRKLHMVPDYGARAEIHEAMGDWDRVTELLVAHVAQYAAGAPPVYGPRADNTLSARLHARLKLERAGRHADARRLFGEE
jgi:hypothetical protein